MRQREFDTKTPRNKYKLLRGTHDGIDKDGARVRYDANDKDNNVVLLTDKQALAFRDKFKPMDVKGRKLFGLDDEIEPIEPTEDMQAPAADPDKDKEPKVDPQKGRMTTPATTGPASGEQKK